MEIQWLRPLLYTKELQLSKDSHIWMNSYLFANLEEAELIKQLVHFDKSQIMLYLQWLDPFQIECKHIGIMMCKWSNKICMSQT